MKYSVFTAMRQYPERNKENLRKINLCTQEQDESGEWINTIEINSLEELPKLDKVWREVYAWSDFYKGLVIDFENKSITIYNTWID